LERENLAAVTGADILLSELLLLLVSE